MGCMHFRPCFVVAFLMIFLFAAAWGPSVAVAQDGAGDVPAAQASPPGTPPPIVPVTTTDPSGFMLLMGSVAGIVSLTIGLTAAVKRGLENTAIGDKLPNWIIVLSLAALMTLLARFVLKSISGDPVQLVFGVLFNTGLSAGVFSLWDGRKTTPTTSADSRAADKASAGVLTKRFILALALGLAVNAAGCATAQQTFETPKSRVQWLLAQQEDAFTLAVTAVDALHTAKLISDKDLQAAWPFIVQARQNYTDAENLIKADLVDQANAKIGLGSQALQQLQVYVNLYKEKSNGSDHSSQSRAGPGPGWGASVRDGGQHHSPLAVRWSDYRGSRGGSVAYCVRENERGIRAPEGEDRRDRRQNLARGDRNPGRDGRRFLEWRVIERLERRVAA